MLAMGTSPRRREPCWNGPVPDDVELKVGVHPFEHIVLQRWHGDGAVRLLSADPNQHSLVVERLGSDLSDVPVVEACRIVAGLYRPLHIRPLPQLPDQADLVRADVEALQRDAHRVSIPRRLVEQTIGLARDLTAEPAAAVLHTDLHYGTVRQHPDGRWLAVDPKPANGDPAYELEPMLRHRWDEYEHIRDDVRHRFFVLFDTAGLDEDRCRDWVIVRSVLNAYRAVDPAEITRSVTIAKAVQD